MLRLVILPFFLILSCLGHSIGEEVEREERKPFDQDQYSGKTIISTEMAYDLITQRFFNAPTLGTQAPDFSLPDESTGDMVSLKELRREQPVVLFFGRLGCDVMRGGVSELLRLHERFRDQFQFVMIYIREAHALDGHGKNRGALMDPKTNDDRRKAAEICKTRIEIPFPILVDTIDDRVATRWAGWPVRLFVVDQSGEVSYSGKPGPWGFDPGGGYKPDRAEQLRAHADRFSQNSLEDFLTRYLDGGVLGAPN
ncbi:MAG: deiodinase-like protein [Verrucomicrobiota bacterium]